MNEGLTDRSNPPSSYPVSLNPCLLPSDKLCVEGDYACHWPPTSPYILKAEILHSFFVYAILVSNCAKVIALHEKLVCVNLW